MKLWRKIKPSWGRNAVAHDPDWNTKEKGEKTPQNVSSPAWSHRDPREFVTGAHKIQQPLLQAQKQKKRYILR